MKQFGRGKVSLGFALNTSSSLCRFPPMADLKEDLPKNYNDREAKSQEALAALEALDENDAERQDAELYAHPQLTIAPSNTAKA